MIITVATTIDELYRKIVAMERPQLCWAFANPRCNETGTCLPSDLCAKIRMHLPPYSYQQLPLHPEGGHAIDIATSFKASADSATVTRFIGGTKEVFEFATTGSSDCAVALASYSSGKKFNERIEFGRDCTRFVYEIGRLTLVVVTPINSASRTISLGNIDCVIPVPRLDFSPPMAGITAMLLSSAICRGRSQMVITVNDNGGHSVKITKEDGTNAPLDLEAVSLMKGLLTYLI